MVAAWSLGGAWDFRSLVYEYAVMVMVMTMAMAMVMEGPSTHGDSTKSP